jgi:ubiquinone/menaquinone biosynthesis C-methylase UbiE
LRPETIENRWDILYREYPEVYDRFASFPYKPKWIDVVNKFFDLKRKAVADIGSGSGLSTFSLAKHAKYVIGIEPQNTMRKLAIENMKKKMMKNVEFKKGAASKIPLKNNSMDIVIAVTGGDFYRANNIKRFSNEARRILVKGGFVISVDIAPGWYGGELAPVILGRTRRQKGSDCEIVRDRAFTSLGFGHKDFYSKQEYGSLENILSTYGFIFGKKAIDYLKKHNKTSIKWKWRIYYKRA